MPDTPFRKRIPVFCILLILLAGVLGTPLNLARAHAEYERSEPPAGAVIPKSPAEIHVWFTQELFRREGANALGVFGPSGTQVDKGDTRIDDDDRTHMIVSLIESLPTGKYTVRWHTLSADDEDEDRGEFAFTVDPTAAETTLQAGPTATVESASTPTSEPALSPTPPPSPTPSSQASGGLPCWSGIVLGGLALGLGVASQRRSRGVG